MTWPGPATTPAGRRPPIWVGGSTRGSLRRRGRSAGTGGPAGASRRWDSPRRRIPARVAARAIEIGANSPWLYVEIRRSDLGPERAERLRRAARRRSPRAPSARREPRGVRSGRARPTSCSSQIDASRARSRRTSDVARAVSGSSRASGRASPAVALALAGEGADIVWLRGPRRQSTPSSAEVRSCGRAHSRPHRCDRPDQCRSSPRRLSAPSGASTCSSTMLPDAGRTRPSSSRASRTGASVRRESLAPSRSRRRRPVIETAGGGSISMINSSRCASSSRASAAMPRPRGRAHGRTDDGEGARRLGIRVNSGRAGLHLGPRSSGTSPTSPGNACDAGVGVRGDRPRTALGVSDVGRVAAAVVFFASDLPRAVTARRSTSTPATIFTESCAFPHAPVPGLSICMRYRSRHDLTALRAWSQTPPSAVRPLGYSHR